MPSLTSQHPSLHLQCPRHDDLALEHSERLPVSGPLHMPSLSVDHPFSGVLQGCLLSKSQLATQMLSPPEASPGHPDLEAPVETAPCSHSLRVPGVYRACLFLCLFSVSVYTNTHSSRARTPMVTVTTVPQGLARSQVHSRSPINVLDSMHPP